MKIIINRKEFFKSPANPTLIAGPCVIENEKMLEETAQFLDKIRNEYEIDIIFKSSYDKANRSSISSFRGPGIEKGLEMLQKIKDKYRLPILVDVHQVVEVEKAAQVADILQIPAFLCRQTDLIVAAGKSGKVVNVKKGQFLSPYEVGNIIDKIKSTGNEQVLITERGFSFGYQNLVVDMRSLVIIKENDCKVIFDGTHSVQYPGAGQGITRGDRRFVSPLVRAAVAVGVNGVFLEIHPEPQQALSDAANQLPFEMVEKIIKEMKFLSRVHS